MLVEILAGGICPKRTSAGYDICTPISLALPVGPHKIKLAIKIRVPPGTFAILRSVDSLVQRFGIIVHETIVDEYNNDELYLYIRVVDRALLLARGYPIAFMTIQPYIVSPIEIKSHLEQEPTVRMTQQQTMEDMFASFSYH